MRLLVCGSRNWPGSWEDIGIHLPELEPTFDVTIIHGACSNRRRPDGVQVSVDILAGIAAEGIGHGVETFPVDATIDGPWPAAGPRRNARMLRDGKPDKGLAFGALWKEKRNGRGEHKGMTRTGTGDMVRKMLAAGLPVQWVAKPGAEAVDLTEMPKPPP